MNRKDKEYVVTIKYRAGKNIRKETYDIKAVSKDRAYGEIYKCYRYVADAVFKDQMSLDYIKVLNKKEIEKNDRQR